MLLLKQKKQNKLSAMYDPDPYDVVSKKGDLVVIERGETLLKRNVGHVKRFIGPTPQVHQPQHAEVHPVPQPLVQQPAGFSLVFSTTGKAPVQTGKAFG